MIYEQKDTATPTNSTDMCIRNPTENLHTDQLYPSSAEEEQKHGISWSWEGEDEQLYNRSWIYFFFDARISFWRSQNISDEEYFRRGARDLECYKRMRFTSVMLSLQSWCSNAVAAISNASPPQAIFYLPSTKPTPLLPLLSVFPLFIWQLCPLWVTGPGCSAAALWHIPSQPGEVERGRSCGDLDLMDRTIKSSL